MRCLDLDVDTLPEIGRIGLGTWQFGSRPWGYGERYAAVTARALVGRAVELGVTLFDTAEVYGAGRSERILGAALGDDAARVVVATKFAPVLPLARVVRTRAYASRDRLGVDRIGLYQAHFPNPLFGTRRCGGSPSCSTRGRSRRSASATTTWPGGAAPSRRSAAACCPTRSSSALRTPDRSTTSCRGRNATGGWSSRTARSPKASSAAATTPTTRRTGFRARGALFRPANLRRARPLLELLQEIAAAHDATPAQIALAWVLHRGPVVAIPGASTVEQLERNAAAAEIEPAADEYTALTEQARAFHPEHRRLRSLAPRPSRHNPRIE